jgi:hypothetical protein
MNVISFFEIQSSDPERDISFYHKVFQWKFKKNPDLPLEYYHIETKGISGALLKRPARIPGEKQGTNAFACLVIVADFDKTLKVILDNGGQVAMPKFAIPGRCWQGYFLDPDHNVFGIFEVDEEAA